MKTKEEPPQGYSFGHVLGRLKYHLVRTEAWNSIALCGAQVHMDSLTDLGGYERVVCKDCFSIHEGLPKSR